MSGKGWAVAHYHPNVIVIDYKMLTQKAIPGPTAKT
jgi:hypothetical protein